jgi:hypothetical protein
MEKIYKKYYTQQIEGGHSHPIYNTKFNGVRGGGE